MIACGVVGSVLTIPYANMLMSHPAWSTQSWVTLAIGLPLQVLLYYVLVRIGLAAARRTGLDGPLLDGWPDTERQAHSETELHSTPGASKARRALAIAVVSGVVCGIVLVVVAHMAPQTGVPKGLKMPSALISFFASVGAGLSEEVMMRIFLMSGIVWIVSKVARNPTDPSVPIWSGIVLSALLFGTAHLPLAAHLMSLNFTLISFVILANGIAGIVFGWLYWRYGIVAAMVSHAVVDIILKVIGPVFS